MSRAAETPQSPDNAGTATNPRQPFTPLRKALVAAVVGVFLLTGAAFASHGFTENPVDVVASQIHDAQASSGVMNDQNATGSGGPGADAAKAAPVVKTSLVDVPVGAQHKESERYGTVSIPALGADWTRFLLEGSLIGVDAQLDQPGTDDPNAVADSKTAIVHTYGTQNLGDLGNVGIQGHRTENTLFHFDTLKIGDTISITDAETGIVYTYSVIHTVKELPFETDAEKYQSTAVMDPIPFDDNSWSAPGHPATTHATKRLLTLTSCGPDPATTHVVRAYVQAELQSVTAGKAGA